MIKDLLPYETAKDVFSIDYEQLYELGYRGLLFDIDNTLVHHNDDSTPEIDALFRKIHEIGFRTLMLSNNSEERILRFLKNIDSSYICEADKPDPACYFAACQMLDLPPSQVIMIGDQLFTDVRGANRAGIPSILVHFIRQDGEKWLGWHRYMEYGLLACYHVRKPFVPGIFKTPPKTNPIMEVLRGEKLFCEISPITYQISLEKEILVRKLQNITSSETFAQTKQKEVLPYTAASHCSNMIKRAPGIDLTLQENKAVNIRLASRTLNHLVIHPGETFSFWKCVGKTTREKGYRDGRVIIDGKLIPGLGGGLCNLANTLHLLVLDSPLTVTELHTHSDALAPDQGIRRPFANGTSVSYNNIDFRFKNNTDQDFQLIVGCKGEMLNAYLRCEHEFPYVYRLVEEDHHFQKEGSKYYRVSKIYRETCDRETGRLLDRTLILDNHSEVMFDPALIPGDQIRE